MIVRRSSASHPPAVVVMAKAPQPGRSKTRLCPPLTLEQAAEVAAAALEDTLTAVAELAADRPLRPVLALDGPILQRVPDGIAVLRQRGRGLGRRLAHAARAVGGPLALIGMDTPQVSAELLGSALDTLLRPGVDAVLGPALDGGWWALGLRRPLRRLFDGVPMSTTFTGLAQQRNLDRLGLRWTALPALRDVDLIDDALAVAGEIPHSAFANVVHAVAPVSGAWP